jgi:hypothetical protein
MVESAFEGDLTTSLISVSRRNSDIASRRGLSRPVPQQSWRSALGRSPKAPVGQTRFAGHLRRSRPAESVAPATSVGNVSWATTCERGGTIATAIVWRIGNRHARGLPETAGLALSLAASERAQQTGGRTQKAAQQLRPRYLLS